MSAYKDNKTGKWYCFFYYRDFTGTNKGKTKRGFNTKREALEWEREFKQRSSHDLEMNFASFVKVYEQDLKERIKLNTWLTKMSIIENKILPYFGEKKINEIKASDVIAWQNVMMRYKTDKGTKLSATSLKSIHNQLSAIFNHGMRFYDLKSNPAAKVGSMGKKESQNEMPFWTKDEYLKFADEMMDKPLSFYAFEMLYWTGIRVGELLALTASDFNFVQNTVTINKSFQRINGEDVITEPKTPKSNRTIQMPDFLVEEIKEYMNSFYKLKKHDRLFIISKSYLHHEMDRGSSKAGLKRIKIHSLRHSHVSLLINMGFSAVDIANRVGHESIDITFRYAHMFPSKQIEMANKLNVERGDANVSKSDG